MITSSKSKPAEQLAATAETTVVTAGEILNSLPVAESELHFIFLFSFNLIVFPSQSGFAEANCGSFGSVITAEPSLNSN
jgi:hypothetical protein